MSTCWICGKEKGQPPERCPGHYDIHSQADLKKFHERTSVSNTPTARERVANTIGHPLNCPCLGCQGMIREITAAEQAAFRRGAEWMHQSVMVIATEHGMADYFEDLPLSPPQPAGGAEQCSSIALNYGQQCQLASGHAGWHRAGPTEWPEYYEEKP